MLAIATFPRSTVVSVSTEHSGMYTSSFSQTRDILLIHDLGMFDSWPDCRDVCVFKRHFQSVEHSPVRFITYGVDTLDARFASVRADKGNGIVDARTTCHPSSRYLGIISFRISGLILIKPLLVGSSEYGS